MIEFLFNTDKLIQQNEFLAWQSKFANWVGSLLFTLSVCCYSLGFALNLCVYGFESFCVDFLNRYADHFVSPLRVTGSAVESPVQKISWQQAGCC